jgi:acetylglutamate kinase
MLKIVKIGGNIVDNPVKLQAFLADFAALDGDKVLVHGGGKVATAISAALGIETTMIEGRRVTDARTLEVVTMVYNGINKQIVSSLQAIGCNAVGLCGADGRLVVSKKRSPDPVDYGFVGDPVEVNTDLAQMIINHGITLVVAPITLDGATLPGGDNERGDAVAGMDAGSGRLLNTNADTVAQTIAVALSGAGAGKRLAGGSGSGNDSGNSNGNDTISADTGTGTTAATSTASGTSDTAASATATSATTASGTSANAASASTTTASSTDTDTSATSAGEGVELIYCFEKQGVMLDVDDENSLIPRIDRARFTKLKAAGAVHGGMLPKLENAFRAIDGGVRSVVICAAENIAKPGYGGTTIVE